MKLSDLDKATELRSRYAQLLGEVNGAIVEVSFDSGRVARVQIDKQLGRHYAEQARSDLKRKLGELGVEV